MTDETLKAIESFVRKYAKTSDQAHGMIEDLHEIVIVSVREATDNMMQPVVFGKKRTLG
jgi:hypothetical protein